MVEADRSGSLKLLVVFVGGGALIAATVIALQGLYYNFEWNDEVRIYSAPNVDLEAMRQDQYKQLASYRLVPREQTDPKVIPAPAFGIPIDEAMDKVLSEQAKAASSAHVPVAAHAPARVAENRK